MQRIFLIILLGFFSSAAYSQSISITIGQGIYAAYGAGTGLGAQTVYTDAESRAANLSSATGMYRNAHGSGSLPIGTLVRVTYTDGSSETFIVIGTNFYTIQARPVKGTQKDKNGNAVSTCDDHCAAASSPVSGGGGEGGSGETGAVGSGRYGPISYRPIYNYTSVCTTDGCTLKLVVVGYEPIYWPVIQ